MAASAKDYASALMYGPQTRAAVRRSEYLTRALEDLGKSSQSIQSGGELGARLLAQALLMRQSEKAKDATLEAMRSDQQSQAAALIQSLTGAGEPPPAPESASPSPPPMAALPAPVQAAPLPPTQPLPTSTAPAISPDIDALVRTVYGEARGEDPLGQQGVAAVILNRAQERGMSPAEVVRQPGQFEPWGNPETRAQLTSLSPDSPEYQAILRNVSPVLQGQVPPEFQGADHFYSPGAQSALGRPPPSWDNGKGRDIGRHRFFDLEQGRGGAPAAPQQPFQVAAMQLQPGMAPSGPAPSPAPPSGGMAPAAGSPQAAAGAVTLPATQAEIERARALLSDPRTFEQGRAYVMELQKRAVTPQKQETVSINGMPFSWNPYTRELTPLGVPDAARTQVMPAQQAGLPSAPQGLYVQRSPLGELKEAPGAPPEGYNAGPNGYAPIAGGPADPYTVQKPQPGYVYEGGRQVAIPGGPADPQNPQNIIEGTKTIRNEIAPVVDSALKLKRSVDSVRVGYAQQGGAGDIAMINGLQRMIDEGVVREGDVALQLQGQGLAGSISGLKGYITSEGFFADPKVRDAVMRTAENLYSQVNENYRQRAMGYRSIVDQTYGEGAFERYVFPRDMAASVGWTDQGQAAGPPAPKPTGDLNTDARAGSREAQLRLAIERGLPLTAGQVEEARRLGIIP